MKIALCFSGEPRFIEECYPFISENLIKPNSIEDIFIHTWYSDEISGSPLYKNEISSFSGDSYIKKNSIERINQLYSPKKIIVDEPKRFTNTNIDWGNSFEKYYGGGGKEYSADEFKKIKINNLYSFMYSNMKSILLKKEYELANDFTYDSVIRSRFDNIMRQKITIGDFDMEHIYYQEMSQPDNMISDWLNFSKSSNMDIYSSIFLNLDFLKNRSLQKYGAYSPESLIREICEMSNITAKGINFGISLPQHGKIN